MYPMKARITKGWWIAMTALTWDSDPKTHKIEKAAGIRDARKLQRRARVNNWPFKFVPNGNGRYGMCARTDG